MSHGRYAPRLPASGPAPAVTATSTSSMPPATCSIRCNKDDEYASQLRQPGGTYADTRLGQVYCGNRWRSTSRATSPSRTLRPTSPTPASPRVSSRRGIFKQRNLTRRTRLPAADRPDQRHAGQPARPRRDRRNLHRRVRLPSAQRLRLSRRRTTRSRRATRTAAVVAALDGGVARPP